MNDDYIKRSGILRLFQPTTNPVFNEWYERIKEIPAADVVPVVWGKWEHDGFNWFCDRCNYNALCDKDTGEEVLSPRCPNCGADMRQIMEYPQVPGITPMVIEEKEDS